MKIKTTAILFGLANVISLVAWAIGGFHFGLEEIIIVKRQSEELEVSLGKGAPLFIAFICLTISLFVQFREKLEAMNE